MTNKTQIDLYREYVRVADMCDAYNESLGVRSDIVPVKPWQCVLHDLKYQNELMTRMTNMLWERYEVKINWGNDDHE